MFKISPINDIALQEKYAAMWRNKCMNRAFNQEFEPIMMFKKQI